MNNTFIKRMVGKIYKHFAEEGVNPSMICFMH
jgi:hypothetical protein